MKIGNILKECPEKVKRIPKDKLAENVNLSFYDYKSMMKHDSYARHNGAIRQIK